MAEAQTWVLGNGSFARTGDYTGAGRNGWVPFVVSLAGIQRVAGNNGARLELGGALSYSGASFLGGRAGRRRSSFLHEGSRAYRRLQVHGTFGTTIGVRWWQKLSPPNMHDINSGHELLDALQNAGEKLVVVEFFGTWCGTCKALYPKLCQIAGENPDIVFLKVNFDLNTALCRSLDVKVLPLFHFYRGAGGRLDSFSCSLSTVQRLRNAIAKHNTERCSIGPTLGLGEKVVSLSMDTRAPSASAVTGEKVLSLSMDTRSPAASAV